MTTNSLPCPVTVPIPMGRRLKNNIFHAYSPKMRRMMVFESKLEYFTRVIFECDPEVLMLCEQPLKIDQYVLKKKLVYTFDLWVRRNDGYEEYIEIKDNSSLIEDSNGVKCPPKWPLISEWAKSNHENIRFMTEDETNAKNTYIRNWLTLLPFVQDFQENDYDKYLNIVSEYAAYHNHFSMREIENYFHAIYSNYIYSAVIYLLYTNKLSCDLSSNLFDKDTKLYNEISS